jgi:hypothetical protein
MSKNSGPVREYGLPKSLEESLEGLAWQVALVLCRTCWQPWWRHGYGPFSAFYRRAVRSPVRRTLSRRTMSSGCLWESHVIDRHTPVVAKKGAARDFGSELEQVSARIERRRRSLVFLGKLAARLDVCSIEERSFSGPFL